MKYLFSECKNLIEVKNLYIKYVKENHPDLGGNTELMQDINAEYDIIKNKGLAHYLLKFGIEQNATQDFKNINLEFNSEAFINVIKFCANTSLEVELCGSWLWISGNSKEVKDKLKELGCKWSSNKSLWYYTDAPFRKRGKAWTLDQIRTTHGSKKIKYGINNLLAA